ncbi:PPE family protein [Mycobacterium seoulense]|uniref:PPE family protein n=1 Tax=Mycobacterium seoulense TaxID=386911 RepID=UPI003CF38B77
MDFTALPPEINSGLMYSGPGAGSMREAATAWGQLAARLCAAAADYRAVLATVVAEHGGPTTMTEAAAPYIAWIDGVAARSELAGIQLAAAVNAHQAALTAMVPPPLIAGNRARQKSLATENVLAQASPVIAGLDAEYEEMWLRDAHAMHAYADASTDAVALAPFTSPPGEPGTTSTTWALESAPEVISTGCQVMSAIPETLLELSSSPRATLEASLAPVTPSLSKLGSLSAPSDFAISHLNTMNKAAALQSLLPNPVDGNDDRVSASLGCGIPVGILSVPHAWMTGTLNETVSAPVCTGWVGAPVRLVTACQLPGFHAASQYDG